MNIFALIFACAALLVFLVAGVPSQRPKSPWWNVCIGLALLTIAISLQFLTLHHSVHIH